jgi:hypothetical protein
MFGCRMKCSRSIKLMALSRAFEIPLPIFAVVFIVAIGRIVLVTVGKAEQFFTIN